MSQQQTTPAETETEKKKTKRITFNIDPETHHAFKLWCTEQDVEMSEVLVKYVEQCLKKRSK